MEFLMTYGWALLIILVMIGAISYFGIMNPSKFLPERCSTSTEFPCSDFRIGSDGNVSLVLKQSIGKTIYFQNFTCSYNGQNTSSVSPGPNTAWNPKNTLTVSCASLPSLSKMKGQKVKVNFDITFTKSNGGLNHTESGEVLAQVQ